MKTFSFYTFMTCVLTTSASIAQVEPPNLLLLEPAPPFADKANEVPKLEAELNGMPGYSQLWVPGNKGLRIAFLSVVSSLLVDSEIRGALLEKNWDSILKTAGLQRAATTLLAIHARKGAYPEHFTSQLLAFLSKVAQEEHSGVWKKTASEQPVHDFAALAAWSNPKNQGYLRELLAARRAQVGQWSDLQEVQEVPDRPWLAFESDALERLQSLDSLTAVEAARVNTLHQELMPVLTAYYSLRERWDSYGFSKYEALAWINSKLPSETADEYANLDIANKYKEIGIRMPQVAIRFLELGLDEQQAGEWLKVEKEWDKTGLEGAANIYWWRRGLSPESAPKAERTCPNGIGSMRDLIEKNPYDPPSGCFQFEGKSSQLLGRTQALFHAADFLEFSDPFVLDFGTDSVPVGRVVRLHVQWVGMVEYTNTLGAKQVVHKLKVFSL